MPISSADLGIRNPDLLQAADDFGADCPGVETVAVLSAFRLKALRLTVVKFLNRPLNMPPPPPCECEGAAGVDGGALGRGDSSKS